VNKPYVVSATIHGPSGWYDVSKASDGKTVAVCSKKRNAERIAALLSEHTGVDIRIGKVRGR